MVKGHLTGCGPHGHAHVSFLFFPSFFDQSINPVINFYISFVLAHHIPLQSVSLFGMPQNSSHTVGLVGLKLSVTIKNLPRKDLSLELAFWNRESSSF